MTSPAPGKENLKHRFSKTTTLYVSRIDQGTDGVYLYRGCKFLKDFSRFLKGPI